MQCQDFELVKTITVDDLLSLIREHCNNVDDLVSEEAKQSGNLFVLAELSHYLIDSVIDKGKIRPHVDDIFGALNSLGEMERIDIDDLLMVGVFELLLDSEDVVSLAHAKLKGGALQLFNETLSIWR